MSPLPEDGSDFQYETNIWIDAPPAMVFEFITDLDAVPEWATKVAAIVNESPGPVAVGKTFDERVLLGLLKATVSWEVIEFESGRLCTFASDSILGSSRVAFIVKSSAGGTDLHVRGSARVKGPLPLLSPLLRRAALQQRLQSLQVIKRTLEERSSSNRHSTSI